MQAFGQDSIKQQERQQGDFAVVCIVVGWCGPVQQAGESGPENEMCQLVLVRERRRQRLEGFGRREEKPIDGAKGGKCDDDAQAQRPVEPLPAHLDGCVFLHGLWGVGGLLGAVVLTPNPCLTCLPSVWW